METSIGGSREAFPETAWSTVLGDPASPRRLEALNLLFSRYWRPVYRVLRTAWKQPIEDAKDHTQGFFNHLLEDDVIAKYRPQRGRFRSFLKGTLHNYMAENLRHDRALKRGGDRLMLTLDADAIERDGLAVPDNAGPDEIFDRQWARDVMRESIEELRSELVATGREAAWKAYEFYELGDGQATYEAAASRCGLTVHQVKEHLTLCRDRLHALIGRRIADGVTSREEFLQELRDLLSR